MGVRLSALVCGDADEAQLAACLRRLAFCDEVVVVAQRPAGWIAEIARRQGAAVLETAQTRDSRRRAAGRSACSGEWILEVEAEETVSPALAWEIRAALRRPEADRFMLPIDNYLGETLVRRGWTGQLSSARAVRLYRAGAAHEGQAAELKGAIKRQLGRPGDLLARLDAVSTLAAQEADDRAGLGSALTAMLRGAGLFLRSYLLQAGWREGRLGLLIAWLSALAPLLAHLKAGDQADAQPAGAPALPYADLRAAG